MRMTTQKQNIVNQRYFLNKKILSRNSKMYKQNKIHLSKIYLS